MIVSSVDKASDFVVATLKEFGISMNTIVGSASHVRRLVTQQDFDLVVINSPLKDESGERLSRDISALNKCQVLLMVRGEYYDDISSSVEDYGVITISKPVNRSMFWFSLKLAKAAHGRLLKMQSENAKLVQKIEDIKIIDRAKHVLCSYLNMTEEEAHKHIERQAMDSRSSRRSVAQGILRLYEEQ